MVPCFWEALRVLGCYNSKVRYWTLRSPVGRIWLLHSGRGLSRLCFSEEAFARALRGSEGPLLKDYTPFREVVKRLEAYFAGERVDFSTLVLDLKGSLFDVRVWKTLQKIPYGEVRTYGWVADKVGRPGGARAVGQACRRNPLPIIVPCHRVIRGSGEVGGYSGGKGVKEALLRIEGYEKLSTHRVARGR